MEVYFSKNAELRFRFPVTPKAITINTRGTGRTVTLADGSELSVPRAAGLKEISFDTLLPNEKYPFAVYPDGVFLPARHYIELVEKLKAEREPFFFIVTSQDDNTLIRVSLEDFTVKSDAADGVDIVMSVRLREWRSAILKTIDTAGRVSSPPRETAAAPAAAAYTVTAGDTLWSIARRFLSDGGRWGEIYQLNRNTISNPNLIYPGQVLVLPS